MEKEEREQKRRQQRRRKADPALGRGSALGLHSGSCLGFSRLQAPADHRGQREAGLFGDVFSAGPLCFPFFWQWTHLGWRRRRRSGAWPALTVVPGQALGWWDRSSPKSVSQNQGCVCEEYNDRSHLAYILESICVLTTAMP